MTEKNGPGQADKKATEKRTAEVAADDALAQADTAAERVLAAEPGTEEGDAVLVDPYPLYEELSLAELRKAAKSRDVEINRDVEKAELVKLCRAKDGSPVYDVMPLEQLRSKARQLAAELSEEFERAHLVTELRAADTHTG